MIFCVVLFSLLFSLRVRGVSPRGVYVCVGQCVPGSLFQCYECPLAPHLVGAARSPMRNVSARVYGTGGAALRRVTSFLTLCIGQLTEWLPAKLIFRIFLNQ